MFEEEKKQDGSSAPDASRQAPFVPSPDIRFQPEVPKNWQYASPPGGGAGSGGSPFDLFGKVVLTVVIIGGALLSLPVVFCGGVLFINFFAGSIVYALGVRSGNLVFNLSYGIPVIFCIGVLYLAGKSVVAIFKGGGK